MPTIRGTRTTPPERPVSAQLRRVEQKAAAAEAKARSAQQDQAALLDVVAGLETRLQELEP